MKRAILLLTFTLCISIAHGQYIKEFSQDTSLYIQELTALFRTSLNENEEEVFNEFVVYWDSIDVKYKADIMLISELMLQRSCRPKPQYLDFISILNEFHAEKKLGYGYNQWVSAYKKFMNNKGTLLVDINKINKTIKLLLDKSKIYSSVSLEWKFKNPDFKIVDSNGIKIITEENDLIGLSSGDSIVINAVTGYVDPIKEIFNGTSGKVYWERAGLDKDAVYADLNNFKLDIKKSEYEADSVMFHYDELLHAPAPGILNDRITQFKSPQLANYPEITTYRSTYVLKNIYEGVNYYGAVAMRGANLAGTSSDQTKAIVEIYYNDTLRVRMHSELFLFGSEFLKSNNAEVALYLENDSIYHPDLVMNYNKNSQLLRLTRSQDYNSLGPYSNSYHKINMIFDELNWVRSEPLIHMQAALGTALGNGQFESHDFYNQQFYESLQGMGFQNPLAELWSFARMLGGNTFAVEAYASNLHKAPYMIRHQLMELSQLGFVYFDFDADMVTLTPKLFDYIDASLKKRDYDVMRFISRTDAGKPNAILDLNTKDLTINGIPTIFLSDSQNVKIIPADNSIVMKRNRNFQFDGSVEAGLFEFRGANFFFDYDKFLINMQDAQTLAISASTGERDAYGNLEIISLDNEIENITGQLLIDAPANKSGLAMHAEYPIFTSRENSYVYFDEKKIQNGVYDKDRFYFELFPFTIDSLDNFSRDALKMEGTFVSADILPPLEMEMSLRPDNSLGFYMKTPEEGLPVYGGKATFYNDLEMSSAGLHGYGKMDYITSTTWSDNFLFHPDSMITKSRKFLERERSGLASYPSVENEVTQVRYYPFSDFMKINRLETVFNMYNDSLFFGGDLKLSPTGLYGNGGFSFPDARFESELFTFQAKKILADSAGAMLKKAQTDDYTFITDDIKIDVDLVSRKGRFSSRGDYSLVKFPVNLYETRLDNVSWIMDDDQVVLTQKKYLAENEVIGIDSLKTVGPSYVSTHPQQDSLNFVAPLAFFNYNTNTLDAKEVPFMEIGDAYIIPKNGDVQVVQKATITPLKGAKILANTESRYHLLHDANLIVDSRLHYRGTADYDYVDEFGDIFTIRFTQVEVDTTLNTFGIGEIALADSFRLSPFFEYQGAVELKAKDTLLNFSGGVRLTHDCDVNKLWLKFSTRIDPDSIMIPVEQRMQNLELNNIYAGTLKARDSIHIYPTFLSTRKDYFDRNLTFSDGFLYYNKGTNTYEIASVEKLRDMNSEGNYLALQTDSCKLYSEGIIDLRLEYGRITMKTVGYASHDIPSNKLNLKLILGLNFYFSPRALNIFGTELDSLPDLEPVDLTTDFYKLAVTNLVGETTADKMETELGLYGNYDEIPDSMKFSILFNDVTLAWNQETRSFRYNGKVGIGTIGDVQVNKYVDTYMEFVERGSGDIFDIYLKLDEDKWYYMAYSPGGFQVLSTNPDFNRTILDLDAKDRTLKSKGRQPSYIFSLASNRRLSLFLDRFLMYEDEK